MSISFTTHCSASAAFLGFVMMGVIRCGTPAYEVSSTRLGSISTMRTSEGLACISRLVIIELTKLDFPDPVEPATSRCGIFARFASTYPPPTSLPTPMVIGWVACWAAGDRSTSPRVTISRSTLGISTPIALLPGIGARMRTSFEATA